MLKDKNLKWSQFNPGLLKIQISLEMKRREFRRETTDVSRGCRVTHFFKNKRKEVRLCFFRQRMRRDTIDSWNKVIRCYIGKLCFISPNILAFSLLYKVLGSVVVAGNCLDSGKIVVLQAYLRDL